MTVALSGENGRCEVTKLFPKEAVYGGSGRTGLAGHQTQLCRRDTIVWEIWNACDYELTLKIDNFRQDEVIFGRIAGWDPERINEVSRMPADVGGPLAKCTRQMSLAPGTSGQIRCQVKKDAHYPRTYKYDIVWTGPGGEEGTLDPELEIYK